MKRLSIVFAAAALAAALGIADPASAAVTAEQAAKIIADNYGVEVLRVRPGEVDSREVWLVTAMVPGGNSNAAFMVSTLAVDRATGDLVSSFRHGHSGYQVPPVGNGLNETEEAPAKIRSRVWR